MSKVRRRFLHQYLIMSRELVDPGELSLTPNGINFAKPKNSNQALLPYRSLSDKNLKMVFPSTLSSLPEERSDWGISQLEL